MKIKAWVKEDLMVGIDIERKETEDREIGRIGLTEVAEEIEEEEVDIGAKRGEDHSQETGEEAVLHKL